MSLRRICLSTCLVFASSIGLAARAADVVVDFDDLSLAPDSYNGGPMDNPTTTTGSSGQIITRSTFESQGSVFRNTSTDWGGGTTSWSGFSYSNMNDRTTEGYLNQYSVYANGGAASGDNFGVAFGYRDTPFNPQTPADLAGLPTFSIPTGGSIEGMMVTNTTYAVLSMLNGDSFAKKFGGDSGDDADWFKLTAYGYTDGVVKSVDFYLADFRFADNTKDYIVEDWRYFDLSSLAGANQIYFNLSSSDVGRYGMNTPAYFAADDISYSFATAAVPEPASVVSAALGCVGLAVVARRRRAA